MRFSTKAGEGVYCFPDVAKRTKTEPAQPSLFEMDEPQNTVPNKIQVERPYSNPQIFLGTSSFTASGWEGSFYPKGMKSTDYLGHYAKTFRTVEIDSTFYATPSAATVYGWYRRTPADFTFALKVPQVITHQKVLNDCDADFGEFLERMELLKEKLGPLLFQFPPFNKFEFKAADDFLARLSFFLKKLPKKFVGKFVVETRNKGWIDERFLNVLREYNVALALTDTSFVPRPWELKKPLNLITTDFAYVRWLGSRRGIEKITQTWDKTVVDREDDLKHWVDVFVRTDFQQKDSEGFRICEQPLRRARASHGQAVLGIVGKEVESNLLPLPIQHPEFRMPKCVVRLKDSHDTVHEAVVYAESLYEAVLRGLNRLVDVGWESDTDETIKKVEVEIHQEPTRHIVDVPKLLNWVKQDTARPGQQTQKEKLRKLLVAR